MISIVVATRNGQSTLPRMLSSLSNLARPESEVEFVFVDNGSTDKTGNILRAFRPQESVKVLREPRPGKTFALNAALKVVRGGLVLFTDDDVILDPEWAISFERVAQDQPNYSVFSGEIRHEWDAQPPGWLAQLADEGRSFGGTPIGFPEGPIPYNLLKGANFGVRSEVLKLVKFSEEFNYDSLAHSGGGEDVYFAQTAEKNGFKIWYTPQVKLKHIVRKDQIGLITILRRYYRIGKGVAKMQLDDLDNPGQLNGVLKSNAKDLYKHSLHFVKELFLSERKVVMLRLMRVSQSLGKVVVSTKIYIKKHKKNNE